MIMEEYVDMFKDIHFGLKNKKNIVTSLGVFVVFLRISWHSDEGTT